MRIKQLSVGAGLVGFGALIGWAATADHFERVMSNRIDVLTARISVLRQRNIMLEDEIAAIEGDRREDISENPPEDETPEAGEAGETQEDPETTRTRLQGIIDSYTSDPDVVQEFADVGTTMEFDQSPPFVISKAKYSWDEEEGDQYDKVTLMYYPRYRTLLDDDEEVIEDVANYVGWRNLARFGDESEDSDVVYIRNRRLRTDFEVVRDEENDLPLHVKYSMGKEEFATARAAGVLKLRPEDRG